MRNRIYLKQEIDMIRQDKTRANLTCFLQENV